jgi:hypothetical protein
MTRRPGAFELIRVSASADSGYSDVGSTGSSSSAWTPASSRRRRQGSADTCSTSPTRRRGKRSAADSVSVPRRSGRVKRRKAIAGRLDESLIAKWMPSNRQPPLVHWLSARSNEISSTMDSSTTLYCGEAAGTPLERDGFLFMVRTMRYPLPGQTTMDEASSRSRSTCPQDRSFAASIA